MTILHGIKINELTNGARAIAAASTAVIGLLAVADADAGADTDALDAAYPVDTPVLVTDIRSGLLALPASVTGSLRPSLEAIADQTGPVLVVIRVAAGADDAATEAALIGASVDGVYTGMQAFLAAEPQLGVRPAIMGVPEHDSQAVTTALLPIAAKLRAMVYAQSEGGTVDEAVTYAGNFSERELCLIWPAFDNDFAGDTTARAMGLRARIDKDLGWNKTISNIAVSGVTGLTRDVAFDIRSDDNDAALLNAAGITTLIRRDGYRFWGNRTQSDEPLFAFESAVRTAHVLQDEMAEGLFWAIDKPMTPLLVEDILETIKARFRRLISEEKIIGANAWYDPALNADADLAAGKLTLDYDFTPTAPLEGLTLNQRITDQYYGSFADLVVA